MSQYILIFLNDDNFIGPFEKYHHIQEYIGNNVMQGEYNIINVFFPD